MCKKQTLHFCFWLRPLIVNCYTILTANLVGWAALFYPSHKVDLSGVGRGRIQTFTSVMRWSLTFSSAVYSSSAADLGSLNDISTIHTNGMLTVGENVLCLYLNASVCTSSCAHMIGHLGEHRSILWKNIWPKRNALRAKSLSSRSVNIFIAFITQINNSKLTMS